MLTAGEKTRTVLDIHSVGDMLHGSPVLFIAGSVLSNTELREFLDDFGSSLSESEVARAVQFLASHKMSNVEFRDWNANFGDAPVEVQVPALAAHLLSREGLASFLSAFPET